MRAERPGDLRQLRIVHPDLARPGEPAAGLHHGAIAFLLLRRHLLVGDLGVATKGWRVGHFWFPSQAWFVAHPATAVRSCRSRAYTGDAHYDSSVRPQDRRADNEDPSDRRGGDLGQTLVPRLLDRGDTPVILDIRAPLDLKQGGMFIQGSVLDRSNLKEHFRGCDCIVHIAAWHGIHESRGEKNAYDFFDLNVRGTFEVFEAAASARDRQDHIHFHDQRSQAGHTVRAQQDSGRAYRRGLCESTAI